MLVSEGIERVQSAYSKGSSSDDIRLSNRLIYSKLRSVRVKIIEQKLNKKQVISPWCYQPIFVELQSVSKHECPELVSDTCTVLKSTRRIPQIFTNMVRLQIKSVTSVDGSHNYSETSWEDIKYKNGRKYASNISEYYFRDGYLYITDKKTLSLITLTALFNDPIEAKNFSDRCGKISNQCISYLDYDFAVDGKLEETIIEICKDELINDFLGREDRQNNAIDDSQPVPKRQSRQNNSYQENE